MEKTVEAILERAKDGTYTVYCKDEIFSGAGESPEAAKADMLQQMAFYKETAIREGFKYPAFLDEDFTIRYTADAASIMKYYVESGVFTLAGLQNLTGINQKQLWAYLHGTKARKKQQDRIIAGLQNLHQDLQTIFIALGGA